MTEARAVERGRVFYQTCWSKKMGAGESCLQESRPFLWSEEERHNHQSWMWERPQITVKPITHKKRKFLKFPHPLTYLILDKINVIVIMLFLKIQAWQEMNTYVQ